MYDAWRRAHLAYFREIKYKREVREWLKGRENYLLAQTSGWLSVILDEGNPAGLAKHTAQAITGVDDGTNARFADRFVKEARNA